MKKKSLSGNSHQKSRLKHLLNIMRITMFLLFVCVFCALSENTHSQNTMISIHKNNVHLEDILNEIETQTGYLFIYNNQVDLNKQTSLKVENKDFEEVLDHLFKNADIDYEIEGMHIILSTIKRVEQPSSSPIIAQQGKSISGTVVDELGEVVIGANITEKGTTNGTITNFNGEFTLTVKDNATLLVSYVGYIPQEISVGNRTTFHIQLREDTQALGEVIVVGYGVQKAETVTGSVSAVRGDDLMVSPTVNFSNSIAGRLPGLVAVQRTGEPGSDDATFRIRGVSTLGDNSPLIVIDGIPGRSMERLSAEDIESMSVLKDASAAIYGAQAANGVILITTKRGSTGKPEVTINYNEGLSQPTVIPKMADAPTYLTLLNEISMYAGQTPKYTAEDIENYRNGGDPWLYPNTDWFGETFKTFASQRRVNASLRGGADQFHYYVSVGGNFQDGIYKNSAAKYSQSNFRGNIDGKLNDYIRVSFDISGRQEKRNYPTRSTDDIFSMLMRGRPNMHAYWPNGLNGPDIEYGNNPVVITTQQSGYDKRNNFILETKANIDIQVPWIQGLSLSLNYAYDKNYYNRKEWEKPWYLYSWDGSSYDANGDPVLIEGKKGFSNPQLNQYHENKSRTTINGILTYDKKFGDHNTKFMAGMERITGDEMLMEASRKYYVSSALDELFAGGDLEKDNTGYTRENKRMNFFGRINYDYKAKYLLEFLWRVDGSYIFPENKRYGFFPGISAGWRISEESFWKENLSLFNYMKLRASWGQTGNDRIATYQFLSSYGFYKEAKEIYVFNQSTQSKILKENRIPNPDVTWERDNSTNVGLDGQMLDGRLTFTAEYFYKLRTNILWNRNASVPTSSGLTLPKENIGEVTNRGFEFQLGYADQAGDFGYSVSVNGGTNKNKIKFWDETPGIPDYQQTTGRSIPFNAKYEIDVNGGLYYKAIGIFRDEAHVESYPHWANARPGDVIFEDVNGDGKIDGLDRVRMDKNIVPRFQGGFNIDLTYKQFYATMFFQWATGACRYRYFEFNGESGNFLQSDFEGRWTPENPDAKKPRAWNRYNEYWRNNRNTYWLEDNDYIRMKNLEIGYNIPQQILSPIGVKNLRVYLSGQNLFTITGVKDFDPETADPRDYPSSRIYNVGLSLNF